MKSFFAGLSFLTILPVPFKWTGGPDDLARSVALFPLIGVMIGLIQAGVALGAVRFFPPVVAGVMVSIALIAISGGLHLDGLSDTADGFLSSRPRERILEIMKDSHVGAMGVIAIVCVFALKAAAFGALPSAWVVRCALLSAIAGRCSMVLLMSVLPYAREDGLAAVFFKQDLRLQAISACFVLVAASVIVAGMINGLVIGAAVIALTLLLCRHSRAKIGGGTGDVCGAACELAELVPPLAMTAMIMRG